MLKHLTKSNKGITLVALIITIIVLCILASIALGTLSPDNGIISKAEEAKNATLSSDSKENAMLKNIFAYANSLGGSGTTGNGNTNNIIGGHTHTFDTGTVTKEPTCAETGVKIYTCTECGETKTETIPATGIHTWNEGVVTVQPTDTDTGIRLHTCTVCGATKEEVEPALGHATCTWDAGVITTQATCNTAGVKTYTCAICKATKTEIIPATGIHIWDAGVVTTQPTESTAGTKLYTCTVCKTTKEEVIPALGHTCVYNQTNTSSTYIASYADCTNAATYYYSCTCGAKGTTTFSSGSALGHSYGNWSTTEEATCDDTGTRTRTCSECGDVDTDIIPAKGHNYTYESTSSHLLKDKATCLEDATYYYECSRCSDYTTSSWWTDSGSALGHSYGGWTTTKEATCNTSGTRTRTCSRCGDVDTDTIDATGVHDWNSNTGKCNDCGTECEHDMAFAGGSALDAYEHSYGEYCRICNYTIDYIEAHNFDTNGKCQATYCGYECIHPSWTEDSSGYGVCDLCGYKCAHPSPDIVYARYSETRHSVTLVCSTCGVEKAAAVPYQNHTWSNGACTGCEVDCEDNFSTYDIDVTYNASTNMSTLYCNHCGHSWEVEGSSPVVKHD